MLQIALIGAGQIGSRHLQALANLNRCTRIYVVDPSSEALNNAKQRFEQNKSQNLTNLIECRYLNDMSSLPPKLDFALIATSASHRKESLAKLFASSEVPYLLLEKIVFQHQEDFEEVSTLLKSKKIRTWVNCPIRRWPGYQLLAERPINILHMSVQGANWGLACNGIHYLDLFCKMTGRFPEFDISGLDNGSIQSRRNGFIEVTGRLTGFAGNSQITLISTRDGSTPTTVTLFSESFHCLIREDLGKMYISEPQTDWKPQEAEFKILYQSQMTDTVVEEILGSGSTNLPDYDFSWKVHVPLLKAIHSHLGSCPIT